MNLIKYVFSLIRLEKQANTHEKIFLYFVSIVLVGLVGYADYITGEEINLSIFYLIPIIIAAWTIDSRAGVIVSLISTVAYFFADYLTGHEYRHFSIAYWNALVKLGFYFTVTYLLFRLKNAFITESTLANTDHVTQIANGRYFTEFLESELQRAERYGNCVTVAYMDVDNFKGINDNFGHEFGDKVLFNIAQAIRKSIRVNDVIARMGGDEFAIIFPEMDAEMAGKAVLNLQEKLKSLFRENKWNISFSMGVVTCYSYMCHADHILRKADTLMYEIKKSGKNMAKFEEIR